MTTLGAASFGEIEALRGAIEADVASAACVADAAQAFTAQFARRFPTVVLARVFVVAPFASLPDEEQTRAAAFATKARRLAPLAPRVPVLCLLGSTGVEPAWCDRELSVGHRAIPLVDRELVDGAPMIAELLSALQVPLPHGAPGSLDVRHLLGSANARFFVPDAQTTTDGRGRRIIADEAFAARYGLRTVFGMGGAFLDGSLVVAIIFTNEALTRAEVDRFPNLVGSFKVATSALVGAGRMFA